MSDPITIVTTPPQPQTIVTGNGPAGPPGGAFALDSPEVATRIRSVGDTTYARVVGGVLVGPDGQPVGGGTGASVDAATGQYTLGSA